MGGWLVGRYLVFVRRVSIRYDYLRLGPTFNVTVRKMCLGLEPGSFDSESVCNFHYWFDYRRTPQRLVVRKVTNDFTNGLNMAFMILELLLVLFNAPL